MARKDLLKGLLSASTEPDPARPPAPPPRMTKGAIGAVGQSIADLKSRSVLEIPAELIDSAGAQDRLDEDPEGVSALAESMRVYGQQVPVLLRHSPTTEGRYEVVYGRRRVAALRLAGLPVKAMLRDLTDHDLMIAQGQENTLRKDLSFVEKANFARQMRDMGFDRPVICDALAVDKTVISRMLTVADSVPLPLLQAIGAAPSVGRDRWMALVERLKDHDPASLPALAKGEDSDARFEAVFRKLAPVRSAPPLSPKAAPLEIPGLGHVQRKGQATVLTLQRDAAKGFDDWLIRNLSALHLQYLVDSQD